MEEKGLQCGHPPWGVISHFLFLPVSVFLASACTLQQKPLKKYCVYMFIAPALGCTTSLFIPHWAKPKAGMTQTLSLPMPQAVCHPEPVTSVHVISDDIGQYLRAVHSVLAGGR